MNKKLLRAGSLLLSILCLSTAAYTGKDETDEITLYSTDKPYCGVYEVTIPVISEIPVIDNNNASEVALEAPKTAQIGVLEVSEDVYTAVTEIVSEDEFEALSRICLGEAENQSELGQRLVVDTVLNRIDSQKWDDDVISVITAKGQYSAYSCGRYDRVEVTEEVSQIVVEEVLDRTNYDVVYFNTDNYATYGTNEFKVGDHYFCSE